MGLGYQPWHSDSCLFGDFVVLFPPSQFPEDANLPENVSALKIFGSCLLQTLTPLTGHQTYQICDHFSRFVSTADADPPDRALKQSAISLTGHQSHRFCDIFLPSSCLLKTPTFLKRFRPQRIHTTIFLSNGTPNHLLRANLTQRSYAAEPYTFAQRNSAHHQ